jgi:ribosome biogenesis protein NSA1
LHSTCPAPAEAGKRQEEKGEVLCKAYVGVVPTCVARDMSEVAWKVPKAEKQGRDGEESDEEEAGDVWDEMEDIGEADSDSDEGTRNTGKRTKN